MAARSTTKPVPLDALVAGRDPKTVIESGSLIAEPEKALAEQILNAEIDRNLEQEAEQAADDHRNGSSANTVLTDSAKLALSIPHYR